MQPAPYLRLMTTPLPCPRHLILLPALLLASLSAAAHAQTPAQTPIQTVAPMPVGAHPVFEVAAIKLSDPAHHRQGFSTEGRHVKLYGESVAKMIMFAYSLHLKQILNLPPWAASEIYDVDGIPSVAGEPDTGQMQEMIQKLLVERFGLTFHRDQREMGFYAITILKGSPRLTPAKPGAEEDQTGNGDGKQMMMKFTANTMDHFALGMQFLLDKPVINETHLPGSFDFTLRWTPNDLETADPAATTTSVFTAFEEQLGLKLEPKKGLVPVIAIDTISRPTAN